MLLPSNAVAVHGTALPTSATGAMFVSTGLPVEVTAAAAISYIADW